MLTVEGVANHVMRRRRLGVVVGLVGVGGLAIWLAISVRGIPPTRSVVPESVAASPAPATRTDAERRGPEALARPSAAASSIEDVLRARADPTAAGIEVLVAGLDADDAVVVAEAANGLVARGAVSALADLVAYDVLGRPWAAPSIIDALGRLGAVAEREQRADVTERLLSLMEEEKRRGARESQGNLLQIYEALGQTGDPQAVPPLERELVDPTVGTAPRVVVVQALVALRAQRSRGVLERLRDQLATSAEGVGFEAELRRDLLAAIRDALVQLS